MSAFYPAATHLYASGDVPFIRCVDCVNYPVISRMQDDKFERIPSSFVLEQGTIDTLSKDEIVITKVGTPCYASIIYEHDEVALSRTVLGVKNIRGINPYYLMVFLRSRYGFIQLLRQRELTIQYQLTLHRVKAVDIFEPSVPFQSYIESLAKTSYQQLKQSNFLYAEAESLLLEELGLKDWQPSVETIAVKSFSESFGVKGRIDAEYYHPDKQRVLDGLAKMHGMTVNEHFISVNETLNPLQLKSDELVQNYDLDDALQFFIEEKESISAFELGSTKVRFQKDDVVVSRLRSYLKEIAVVDTPETANCVGSSEFIVLRPRSGHVNSELLLVFLRSLPIQQVLKWCQSGSNHPRFMEEDLLSIKIPEHLIGIQQQIKRTIRTAIESSRKSKLLLEIAKRGVEIAIEQDEAAAMAWMNEQTRLMDLS